MELGPYTNFHISIHVPAWGTTRVFEVTNLTIEISIHVPAWGTTSGKAPGFDPGRDFNPRSRVGNDQSNRDYNQEY